MPPAAAVAPSCFRRAEEAQRPAALSGPAWWQVPAAASHQPAGAVVESSVRPAASVPQVRLPAEEAAAVWGAKVQPQEAAEVLPGPSAQQPVEAEEAASDAEEARQPVAAAAGALDVVAEPQRAGVAAAVPDAEVPQPGVAEVPAPSVRQPAARP